MNKFSFLVLLIKGDKQFLGCCNDPLFADPVHDALKGVYMKCQEETGDDTSDCFHTCIFQKLGFYGEDGVDFPLLRKMNGPEYLLGDDSDWKKVNAGPFFDKCILDTPGGQKCNPDLLKIAHCYWNQIFMSCPSFNPLNC